MAEPFAFAFDDDPCRHGGGGITRQARYRIVTDNFAGYEAQYQPVFLPSWWPFWAVCCYRTGGRGVNTNSSIERAEELCKSHQLKRLKPVRAGEIVKNLGAVEPRS